MESDLLLRLVLDALYANRVLDYSTCLQANIAAFELCKVGDAAIPAIERVLQETVIPGIKETEEMQFSGLVSFQIERQPFPGLTMLLSAYLIIGLRESAARIVSFARSLPDELIAEIISSAQVCLESRCENKGEFGNFFLPVLPSEYVDFVNEMAQSSSAKTSDRAKRLLDTLKSKTV